MKNLKKTVLNIVVLLCLLSVAEATEYRKHRVNIKALSTTKFELTDVNHQNPKIRDLKGQDFIVVSVREPGSDGKMYAVDRDGTIWWHAAISSGAGGGKLVKEGGKDVVVGGHETSNNIFKVLLKRRFHMSAAHPSLDGINNMDFELRFTPDGQSLHLGNIAGMSHGCIHVDRQDIAAVFKWAKVGMPVVIMRGHYIQHLNAEIGQFQKDIKDYDKATP
ncbi:MAG: L,D-transpeptidase family protein [Campylobacterota bacterium]|nr:L,D-transpeptidase family protein [Campylobacterota bacterium]